tara:strand:- start:134 stop:1171 length:1038 start_codon:yes stop_codon:yes gene_type:complete
LNKYLYSTNNKVDLYLGNNIDVIKTLPDESVNCVVTSPPYFGLRDYGTATWSEGDPNCNHKPEYVPSATAKIGFDKKDVGKYFFRDVCESCGAKRVDHQVGLEITPEQYIDRMVNIFEEIKRVLTKDGTIWINIGDSYVSHRHEGVSSLKKKDMIGIPWRLAFGLQSAGWYLRQDIIWHKPNPMPESVVDRCTKAHEYIFLLSKSEKYYYNQEALKEEAVSGPWNSAKGFSGDGKRGSSVYGSESQYNGTGTHQDVDKLERNKRSVWSINLKPYKEAHFAVFPKELPLNCIKGGCPPGGVVLDPFAGSGTTLEAAQFLGMRSIGIDIGKEYLDLCLRRTSQQTLF